MAHAGQNPGTSVRRSSERNCVVQTRELPSVTCDDLANLAEFLEGESLRLGRRCLGRNPIRERVEPMPNIVHCPALSEQGKKSRPCPKRNAGEIFVDKQLDAVVHRTSAGDLTPAQVASRPP